MKNQYIVFLYISLALTQNIGNITPEKHIKAPYYDCKADGCTKKDGFAVIESSWRWLHYIKNTESCRSGSSTTGWNSQICPDPKTCAQNCGYEGVNGPDGYKNSYGVIELENGIRLNYKTGNTIGSRLYILQSDDKYKLFSLLNKQISFDLDVSSLQCGMNGSVYFSQMQADGGSSKYPSNKAGAKYGTGYCDAQCFQLPFIYGEANSNQWGVYGACCAQLDLIQANKQASAFTAHPCSKPGYYRCNGTTDCGFNQQRYDGICDKDGHGNNAYRNGNKNFYGPGSNFQVDTTQKFTVVTQFLTSDGTDQGELVEIKRHYIQNGKKILNPKSTFAGMNNVDSLSNLNSQAQTKVMSDSDRFIKVGGMKAMGESLKRGMVLVVSLWDDHSSHMKWLDSIFPSFADVRRPGVIRGPCSRDSGDPEDLRKNYPNSYFSVTNIRSGPIGTTQMSENQEQSLQQSLQQQR